MEAGRGRGNDQVFFLSLLCWVAWVMLLVALPLDPLLIISIANYVYVKALLAGLAGQQPTRGN